MITGMGYDMLFWGVLMLVIVETGMITPPFGMNLFIIIPLFGNVQIDGMIDELTSLPRPARRR